MREYRKWQWVICVWCYRKENKISTVAFIFRNYEFETTVVRIDLSDQHHNKDLGEREYICCVCHRNFKIKVGIQPTMPQNAVARTENGAGDKFLRLLNMYAFENNENCSFEWYHNLWLKKLEPPVGIEPNASQLPFKCPND